MKGESSWGCVVCLQARSLVSTGEGKGKAPLPGDSLLYVPPSLGGPGSGSRKLLPLYSCLCSSSFFVPRIESLFVRDLRTGRDEEGTPSRHRPRTESTSEGRRDTAASISPTVHMGASVENASVHPPPSGQPARAQGL